jgi:hypothetical protein
MAAPLHASPDSQTLEPGIPVRLFRAAIVGAGSIVIGGLQEYDVSADGQRFLINMTVSEAAASPISIVLNWQEELKQRVPTR